MIDRQGNQMDNIEEIVRRIVETIRDNYINEEIAPKVASALENYIGSAGWKRATEAGNIHRLLKNLNCIITTETDDTHFSLTHGGSNWVPAGVFDGGITRYTPHYIHIREFQPMGDEFVRASYTKVFAQFQDPLVIDIRNCPGGSPELVYFILCHFFPDGTPMLELQTRHEQPVIFKSASEFPFYTSFNQIKKYTGRIYVLVNGNTASAAESLAYAIQHRSRGKIYGTRTYGSAYMQFTTNFDNISLHLPHARTCDPDTHVDWEGIGIKPDFEVGSREYISLIYGEVANNVMVPADPHT
jgi:hypothetical protein